MSNNSASQAREWLAPASIAALTFLTFLPVLWNEFLAWDDDRDLTGNPYYRGLGWTQLVWMFSLRKDHYYPLTRFSPKEQVKEWQVTVHRWRSYLKTSPSRTQYRRRLLGAEYRAALLEGKTTYEDHS